MISNLITWHCYRHHYARNILIVTDCFVSQTNMSEIATTPKSPAPGDFVMSEPIHAPRACSLCKSLTVSCCLPTRDRACVTPACEELPTLCVWCSWYVDPPATPDTCARHTTTPNKPVVQSRACPPIYGKAPRRGWQGGYRVPEKICPCGFGREGVCKREDSVNVGRAFVSCRHCDYFSWKDELK